MNLVIFWGDCCRFLGGTVEFSKVKVVIVDTRSDMSPLVCKAMPAVRQETPIVIADSN